MYTNTQSKIIYGLTIIAACVGIMASCSERKAHAFDSASSPAFVTPFMPAGDCVIPYSLNPGARNSYECTLIAPAGVDPLRVRVLATIATGNSGVFSSIEYAQDTGLPWDFVQVLFELRNESAITKQGAAAVTVSVAQGLTPAAATAGVK